MTYFHGGAPGLRQGDVISPRPPDDDRHLVPGCAVCEARRRGNPSDYDVNHRFDRIYVTTERFVALCFAAGYPQGDAYYVEPLGELEPDPEYEASWAVSAARVKAVLRTRVEMGPIQMKRWLRLSGGPMALQSALRPGAR